VLLAYLRSLLECGEILEGDKSDPEVQAEREENRVRRRRHEERWADLKQLIEAKFPGCLSEQEKMPEVNLFYVIDIATMLSLLQSMVGCKFSHSAFLTPRFLFSSPKRETVKLSERVLSTYNMTMRRSRSVRLLDTDLVSVYVRVKHMNIIDEVFVQTDRVSLGQSR